MSTARKVVTFLYRRRKSGRDAGATLHRRACIFVLLCAQYTLSSGPRDGGGYTRLVRMPDA